MTVDEETILNDSNGLSAGAGGVGLKGGRYWKEGKGWEKVAEFRRYLDGERSGRNPRFDLKVFQCVFRLSCFLS